ncbi:hypothetical protein BH11MYX1_BH11MYX1_41870 [soil metagenome]
MRFVKMRALHALGAMVLVGCAVAHVAKLVIKGDTISMIHRPAGVPASSPSSTPIMVFGLDGVSRDLLYDLLRAGKLPNLTELLGGDALAHADLDAHLLTNLPSTTMPAWTSTFTGVGAAQNGVPNNEYFVRETKTFECPGPVTFADSAPTLEIYTEGYLNKLVGATTVYEQIHEKDQEALIWVVMNHLFRGADTMLLAKRQVMVKAFESFVEKELSHVSGKTSRATYESLDRAVMDALITHLKDGPTPDVLTLYLAGTDLYAHVAVEGPDEARKTYLTEVVDPALGPLVAKMRERNMLDHRWIIVTADHGHTQVVHDEAHAIDTGETDAPGVLHHLGFHIRPFKRNVASSDPFNAVLAYGGAMGFVYLADRTRCAGERPCTWTEPPRYKEDVLAVADAFFTNNEDGALAPGMKGALDMIFVRVAKPVNDIDLPFEVYVGNGKTMSIDAYLDAHPHPTYVAVADRMRELAVGPHGERAGDVLLLAHNGDRDKPEDRFYFAAKYRSWHGSPSRQDSEIPLIVANPKRDAATIAGVVEKVLGDQPYQRKITDLIMRLRESR